MGLYLDLADVAEGHPEAMEELSDLYKVVDAAVRCVSNPSWAGVCDEDVELEAALRDAGFFPN